MNARRRRSVKVSGSDPSELDGALPLLKCHFHKLQVNFDASDEHQRAHNAALMAFTHVSLHFICANGPRRKAH